MSPEAILRELRDVHLPPPPEGASDVGLAWWPFAVLAAAAAAVALIGRARARRWRREGRARLAVLRREPDPARRRAAMAALLADLARIGRAGRAPDCAHYPPARLGPAEEARLDAHLAAVLGARRARP